VLVKVRGKSPATCMAVEIEDRALPDIDEKTNTMTAPVRRN